MSSIKTKKFLKLLNSYGYYKCRQKGSHVAYKKNGVEGSFIFSIHEKEVPYYIIKRAIKLLNLSQEEFEKKIKEF